LKSMGQGRVSHLRIEIAKTQVLPRFTPPRVKTYVLHLLVLILMWNTIATISSAGHRDASMGRIKVCMT
jgi:hypothetical protein